MWYKLRGTIDVVQSTRSNYGVRVTSCNLCGSIRAVRSMWRKLCSASYVAQAAWCHRCGVSSDM
eukprot:3409453-Pyramimonas_sp.AAC.1